MTDTINGLKINETHCADAIEFMARLPEKSIDAVICDPPYGLTDAKWDDVIPLQTMWAGIERIIKPGGAIVLTSSDLFTIDLTNSKREWWRFRYTWDKRRVTGQGNVKNMPLKAHEDVTVFSSEPLKAGINYFPQVWQSGVKKSARRRAGKSASYGHFNESVYSSQGERQPTSVLRFSVGTKDVSGRKERGLYPNQKPLELFKHLIRQHTGENALILDFAHGSGTTGLAALETGRRFIACDSNEEAVSIANRRCAAYTLPML